MSDKKIIRKKLSYIRKHLFEIMRIVDDEENGNCIIFELLDSVCGILSVVDTWTYSDDYEDEE